MKIRACTYINRAQQYVLLRNGEQETIATGAPEQLYKDSGMAYPRFYRMNPLSQTALLLAEPLMQTGNEDPAATAIFAWNRLSSYDADIRHRENIDRYIANPANFVYTLPNIAVCEIAIRHKLQGENGFYISEQPDLQALTDTVALCFARSNTKRILAGWIESGPEFTGGFLCDIIPSPQPDEIFRAELGKIRETVLL